ncbi:MAG: fibronectin type III domain-containing protein [Balneolaceae bacterium]
MSTILRKIEGQLPNSRMNQYRAVSLHRAFSPFVPAPGSGSGGEGSPAFINAQTRINLWNRVANTGISPLISDMYHGVLKNLLLPYYEGDEGLYYSRVVLHEGQSQIDRPFQRIGVRSTGHPNSVNIMFIDRVSYLYIPHNDSDGDHLNYTYWHNAYHEGEPSFRQDTFESDMGNLRAGLANPDNEPIRGKLFVVKDELHDQQHSQSGSYVMQLLFKSVEQGLGDYAPPWGLSDYGQIQFGYNLEMYQPEGYYADFALQFLKSLGIEIEDPRTQLPTGDSTPVFHTDFDGSLDDWSLLWGFNEWELSCSENGNEGDQVLKSSRAITGTNAIGFDRYGDLADGELRSLVRAGSDAGFQNQLIARAFQDESGRNGYYARLSKSGGSWFQIVRETGSSPLVIANLEYEWDDNSWYWILFRFHGHVLSAKIWEYGTEEPDWMTSVMDSEIQTGRVGVGRTAGGNQLWDTFSVGVFEEPVESPLNLLSQVDETTVAFSWDPVDEVDGYNLYLEGVKHNEVLITDPVYTIHELGRAAYSAHVTAVRGIVESQPGSSTEFMITGDAPENFEVEVLEGLTEPPANFDVEVLENPAVPPENFAVELVESLTDPPENVTVEVVDASSLIPENFGVSVEDSSSIIPQNFTAETTDITPQSFGVEVADMTPQSFEVEVTE